MGGEDVVELGGGVGCGIGCGCGGGGGEREVEELSADGGDEGVVGGEGAAEGREGEDVEGGRGLEEEVKGGG